MAFCLLPRCPNPPAPALIAKGEGQRPDRLWSYRPVVDANVINQAGEEFEPAQPKFLFKHHFFGGLTGQNTYSVAKDGRFLMIQEDLAPGTQINVVSNWFEELKRLMPPGKE